MGTRAETNLTVGGNLHVEGNLTVDGSAPGGGGFPVGTVLQYSLTTLPDGWAWCDGSALTEASELRTAYIADSYPYGQVGSDPKTPDMRLKFPYGTGTGAALGSTGGVASHDLTHTHTVSTGIKHAEENDIIGGDFVAWPGGGIFTSSSGLSTIDNKPPFISLNFIVKL